MITLWIKDETLDFSEWMKKDNQIGFYEFIMIGDEVGITIHPESLAAEMGLCKPRCNIRLYISDVRIDKHLLNKSIFFRL